MTTLSQFTLPSPHDEAWRYTQVAPIGKLVFTPAGAPLSALPAGLQADLVFVAGRFMPALSANFADSVTIKHKVTPPDSTHAFAKMNATLAVDGADLHVHSKATVRILHIADGRDGVTMSHPQTRVVVDAEATVIERFVTIGEHACFTNAVTELIVNAPLRYLKWQDESAESFHIGAIHVRQNAKADLTLLGFGGKLARTDVFLSLGEETETQMRGLLLAGKGQTQDALTYMDHAKPGAVSKQLFKGVLDHDGRVAYDGRIRVAPNAQKTNAAQKNQNLLLSKDATAASKPHLEIYADDVKCAHGSTSGQISGEALFYLRSRGISEKDAKTLLTMGFAGEVIDAAPALQDEARARVAQWLR